MAPTRAASFAWIVVAYLVACVAGVAATYAALGWLRAPTTGAWLGALAIGDIAATVIVFAFSVALDNSSVYDPYWSLVPIALGGAHLWQAPAPDWTRASCVAALVVAWGARLTWNWARGWAGLHHEDWRYRAFRERFGGAYWPVSFLGIHLAPTGFTFAGCLALAPALWSSAPFQALDVLASLVTVLAIALESVADGQLRRFTLARAAGALPADAICDTGLWARCRHPNYLGEILFWWGVWLFGVAAAPDAWLWTLVGPLTITVMFVAVTLPMMDRRHVARRPAYADHMRRVPSLLPRLTRPTSA